MFLNYITQNLKKRKFSSLMTAILITSSSSAFFFMLYHLYSSIDGSIICLELLVILMLTLKEITIQ